MNKFPHIYVIAEAGVNHNGSVDFAIQLIDAAAKAKADAIKFQTFKAEQVLSRNAPKAEYQKQATDTEESQLEMAKKLELNEEEHQFLITHCLKRNIQFLSSPSDLDSVDFLTKTLKLPQLKIGSGEITNALLLLRAAQSDKSIILSTGMSTIGEVETALGVLAFGYTQSNTEPSSSAFRSAYASPEGRQALQKNVVLLQCTTEYPAPYSDANLRVMDTLVNAFGLTVGFSDHTPGIVVPIAAAARGAAVIEKHFTLDKNLPGPDHQASLEPDELKEMIQAIRCVELALGSPLKVPAPSELKNRDIVRKSLIAACDIQRGDAFTKENLTVKRPGTGRAPIEYWGYLGKSADRMYRKDDII